MTKKKSSKSKTKKADQTKHLVFVLDETGSMTNAWKQTIDAVNEYFSGLKKEKNLTVTLMKFSSIYPTAVETICEKVSVDQVPKLNMQNYYPAGMTPLHDCTAHGILACDKSDADQKLVTIYTDGKENCSVEYKLDDVKKLIEERKKTMCFTFLGADIDAYAESEKFGVARAATMAVNKAGAKATMDAHLGATRRYFASGLSGQSMDFYLDEDKLKAES